MKSFSKRYITQEDKASFRVVLLSNCCWKKKATDVSIRHNKQNFLFELPRRKEN